MTNCSLNTTRQFKLLIHEMQKEKKKKSKLFLFFSAAMFEDKVQGIFLRIVAFQAQRCVAISSPLTYSK